MKQQKTWFTIVGLFFGSMLSAQDWHHIYFPNQSSILCATVENYDKGYIMVGYYDQLGIPQTGLIIKTDINGNILWSKCVSGGDGNTAVNAIDKTDDNGLVLTGGTRAITGSHNPYILKLDPCGQLEWCRIYNLPFTSDEWGRSIRQISGGYLAVIYAYGDDIEKDRLWLYRLDNEGELIWKQSYSHSDTNIYNAEGFDLLLTDDNKFVISGDCYYPDAGIPWIQYLRPYVMETDSSGNVEWELPWHDVNGENFYGESNKSIVDNKGMIYTSGRQIVRSGPNVGDKVCLMKTDQSGNEDSYSSYFLQSAGGVSCSINWFQDSTIALGYGYSDETWTGPIGLLKCDKNGSVLKDFQMGYERETFADGVLTFDNKLLLVTGIANAATHRFNSHSYKVNSNLEYDSIYTVPRVYDSLCPHPIPSDTIPLDCVVVGLPEKEPEKQAAFSVFPNPFTDILHIKLPDQIVTTQKTRHFNVTNYRAKWSSTKIEIYNLSGERMFSKDLPFSEKEILVSTSSWPKGLYLVRLVYNNSTVETVKIIKQ